ncbi:MAG: hypothetical protein DYG89_33995 [Caldilinea sp. CFX5]|nr:hypothetical protein [Caldilinea sp. CFX5]
MLLIGLCGATGCVPLIQPPTPVAPAAAAEEVHLIVQVQYPTVEVLNALAGELDVWEVDRTAQTFVARITLAQFEMLQQQDLPVALDCAKMEQYEETVAAAPASITSLIAEQCKK